MITFKIEVGKFYQTRDGLKVRIYATDGNPHNSQAVHGAVLDKNQWNPCAWAIDLHFQAGCINHVLDIVGEWKEPEPRLVAYVRRQTTNTGNVIDIDMTPIGGIRLLPPGSLKTGGDYVRALWLDQPIDPVKDKK